MNPTLYSVCFAGEAKRSVLCTQCLSDGHGTGQCPDNLFLWPGMFGPPQGLGSVQSANLSGAGGVLRTRQMLQTSYLFNAKEGPRCTYSHCKFAHRCAICKGPHARYFYH